MSGKAYRVENATEVNGRGQAISPRSACIDGRTVLVEGRVIKIASIFDEQWIEGACLEEPRPFIDELQKRRTGADIFVFTQQLPDLKPRHEYHIEWDNIAVIPVSSYETWFKDSIEYDVRKAVKKAVRMGVQVKAVSFSDEFVNGIQQIYNESPVRQGKYFWHYGKDFKTVKLENSTYLDRSEFIGAYYQNELIGYIRLVYIGCVASTLQVIAMNRHFDKKPVNALIAKAVEICEQKKMRYLVYDRYDFGSKDKSSFTEFKRRNGFQKMPFPRYFVPLTLTGELALRIGLHRGIKELTPSGLRSLYVRCRAKVLQLNSVQSYLKGKLRPD